METVLPALALLACPVGMGLMMWFMSKAMKPGRSERTAEPSTSVEDLRREQSRIAAEIDRLDPEGGDGRLVRG